MQSRSSGRLRGAFLWWSLACGLILSTVGGCSRKYYRLQADAEAYQLIQEKGTDERWARREFSVYPDVRSRFYDPYDPDYPPMPPDDPESHQFMHEVYGMKGSKHWHDYGDRVGLENPYWRDYLEQFMRRDEDGYYILDLDATIQLALLHSPDYQRNLEELYLSALDVAFERFRFDTQFFGGNLTNWFSRGPRHPQAFGGQSSSQLSTRTYLGRGGTRTLGAVAGIQKLLPTGGQLLANFANSFVWEFAGSDQNLQARSVFSFTFIQPLLRAGGRDVVLERLTIAERALLANLRQMARYEKRFYADLYYGGGTGSGPRRRGGFLGGAGLTGFVGLGAGGFGSVGEAVGFGRFGGFVGGGAAAGGAAGAGFAAGVAVNVGGFYGLVQRMQQIRNREANLQAQFDNLARVEALFEAGRIDRLQVDQFRQNVQSARSQYLDALVSFQRTLESFLTRTLGLPPDLPVKVDEEALRPFQFMAPEVTALQREVRAYLDEVRGAESPSGDQIRRWIEQFRSFREQIGDQLAAIAEDVQRAEALSDERLRHLESEEERREFLDQLKTVHERYEELISRFQATEAHAAEVEQLLAEGDVAAAHNRLTAFTDELSVLLLDMPLVQAAARLETLILQPVELDSERAFRIALANRLDIMNQRAEVVDQWRLIAFNADDLESDLDIEFGGEINTVDRNIAKFRGKAGQLTAALQFDAPLTRLGERNEYRQALIDYQRVRRDYIGFLDAVHASLRDLLRRIDQFKQEMELRRRAMRIAIRTMDLTQEQLRQPPRVTEGQTTTGLGPTAVRDLLAAFSDLLNTQNDVMGTYLNYEALRMQLYIDLGIAKFDERGHWIDEPLEDALYGVPEMDPYGPPLCPLGHYVPPPDPAGADPHECTPDCTHPQPEDGGALPPSELCPHCTEIRYYHTHVRKASSNQDNIQHAVARQRPQRKPAVRLGLFQPNAHSSSRTARLSPNAPVVPAGKERPLVDKPPVGLRDVIRRMRPGRSGPVGRGAHSPPNVLQVPRALPLGPIRSAKPATSPRSVPSGAPSPSRKPTSAPSPPPPAVRRCPVCGRAVGSGSSGLRTHQRHGGAQGVVQTASAGPAAVSDCNKGGSSHWGSLQREWRDAQAIR